MRFQVPQFIEVEDKIFGPLTFKQFIYLAGSVGIAVILFALLPKFLAFVFGLPIVLFGAALAFYKVNGKPFIYTVEAFLKYTLGDKLYLWQKQERAPEVHKQEASANPEVYIPKLSQSKLKDLSWSLDVQANQNPVTKDNKQDSMNNVQ
ncbi:PrgI family protein [Candidatus Parcubacteria bacterium]|nr:PrgI family protein [Candidatus Parcubacteria bacterium]